MSHCPHLEKGCCESCYENLLKEKEDSENVTFYLDDNTKHIHGVQRNLRNVIRALLERLLFHDISKYHSPERELLSKNARMVRAVEYGSEDYNKYIDELKPIREMHNAVNRHHPEHHLHGIQGMNLIDILEMLCDWEAASRRQKNGSIRASIEVNQKRFGYSDELKKILINTLEILEKPQ